MVQRFKKIHISCCFLFCFTGLGANQLPAGVVINEIFYHAPDELKLEYVELYNAGSNTVDLSGWKLSKGIKFTFDNGTKLAGGEFLVVAKNADLVKEFYDVDVLGEYKKSLSNSGDELRLTDHHGNTVESLTYKDRAPWPISADGYSASLERICPNGPANQASNWAPSKLSNNYDLLPSGTPGQVNSVFAKNAPPRIESVSWKPIQPKPGNLLNVVAKCDFASVESVLLRYQFVMPGTSGDEQTVEMHRTEQGVFQSSIPTGNESNRLLRFRVEAMSKNGGVAFSPAKNEIRPTYTAYVNDSVESDSIPVIQFFHIQKAQFEAGEQYRKQQEQPSRARRGFGGFGGPRGLREFSPEDRMRMETEMRIRSVNLAPVWANLTLRRQRAPNQLTALAENFYLADVELQQLLNDARTSDSLSDFRKSLPDRIAKIRTELLKNTKGVLTDKESQQIETIGIANPASERRRGFGRAPGGILQRVFNVEESWFRIAKANRRDAEKLAKAGKIHRDFLKKRNAISLSDDDFEIRIVFEKARLLDEDMRKELSKVLGPQRQTAQRFGGPGFGRRGGFPGGRFGSRPPTPLLPQGPSAVIYTDPKTGESEVFDFVNIVERKSGWKARFHKDRPFLGMTTVNFLYEPDEATMLNEALAYELYRLAGNSSYLAGYMRVIINGKPCGYHLYFEQPNGNFFRRNKIDDDGDLYKLIWMGNAEMSKRIPEDELPTRRDIAGRHEKKSNRHEGYQDLIGIIEKLENAGSDAETWKIIEDHFEIDQVVNYFAVNSLLSHWDGFFNNYFAYLDRKGSGKWSMYPWDQDSTWSQRGGRSNELYEMPLFFGAEGATPDGIVRTTPRERQANRRARGFGGFGRGFGGPRGGRGFGWWRNGGDFSRPLLANPRFYSLFTKRLDELTETVFNEKVFGPKIDALLTQLTPEVMLRAEIRNGNKQDAVDELRRITDSLREHLIKRREFVIANLQKENTSPHNN